MNRFLLLFLVIFTGSEMTSFGQCTATITPAGPLTFCQGGSVVLNANTAAGNTYVWRRNGSIVQSGSGSSYTATVAAGYTVQITTSSGCTALSPAVSVNILVNGSGITANGYTGIGCVNGGMTLAAVSYPGNTYQWKLNGANISGQTASTYVTSIAGNYTCQITNGSCSVLSNSIPAQEQVATLTVNGPTTFCTWTNTNLYVTLNIGLANNSYQWQRNNIDIAGATSYTYAPTITGSYRCRVTSAGFCNASTYSNSVNIQAGVTPQLYIATGMGQLSPADICSSFPVDLWLHDASDSSVWNGGTVDWFYNNSHIFGGNNMPGTNSGDYYASVQTTCGVSYSPPFYLRILNSSSPPKITTWTSNFPACGPVTLYVDEGYITYNSYQWKKDGVVIQGATQSSYPANSTGNYSCIVSNNCGTMESEGRYINILPEPSGVITASSPSLCSNSSVLLTAETGTNFSYRWRLNGTIITGATQSTYNVTQPGNYDCKIYNNCGDTAYSNVIILNSTTPPNANITAPVATSLCSGTNVNLSATSGGGFSYQWFRNNALISSTGQAVYNATLSGHYSVIITNSGGCRDTSETVPVFFGSPAVNITSNVSSPVCPSTYVTFTANVTNGTPDSYQWKLNGTDIPYATNATLSTLISAAGTYSVVVKNPCGTVTSNGLNITLKPATPASITASGPTGFCPPASVTFNANTGAGLSYQWYKTYSNGPVAGATSSSYTADTTGLYWVVVTSSATGCVAGSNQIRVSSNGIVASVTPAGPISACSTTVLTANAAPGFTYQWRKNGGNIAGANSQNYTVTSSGTYTVTLTGTCGISLSNEVKVDIYTAPFTTSSTQIYPSATSGCANSGLSIGINRFILPPYVNNSPIQWLLNGNPLGGPIQPTSSNAVLVPAVSGNYSMQITNACGTQTSNTVAITIHPLPTITIAANGPTTICSGSNVVLSATTSAGVTRQWRRNNQILNNATGANYTASVPGSYTCVATSANGCVTVSNEIDVIVNGNIAAIQPGNGSFYVCKNTTGNVYTIPSVSGATGYTWSVPTGATITSGQNTTSIIVSYSGSAANGNICVYASVPCGNGPSACIPVRVVNAKPVKPLAISGPVYPCSNTTGKIYSCTTVPNASTYTWVVPNNAVITSGQGTNRITIDFNSSFVSGTIKVSASNCIGTSAYQKLLVYGNPKMPSSITGPDIGVCPNTTKNYSISTVPGATQYIWTAPSNASISGGQSSTAVSVYFNSQYTKDTLFVSSYNSCGLSPKRSLIVKTVPGVPGNISGPGSVCANQTGVNYSIAPVTGASSYEWAVPPGATITGGQGSTSITVSYGSAGGKVKVRAGNACGYGNYRAKIISMPCRAGEELSEESEIVVFPNPASHELNVILKTQIGNSIDITLTDISGKVIMQQQETGQGEEQKITFDIQHLSSGLYFLKASANKETWIEKVIVE